MPDSNLSDGDVLTSTFWNTYVREQVVTTCTSGTRPSAVEGRMIAETDDNLLRVYDGSTWNVIESYAGWTTFTPSWTNLTTTSGTSVGRYARHGTYLEMFAQFTFGASSAVTGNVQIDIPGGYSTHGSLTNSVPLGQATFYDDNTGDRHTGIVRRQTSTTLNVQALQVTGADILHTALSSTIPFTWATTDAIAVYATIPLA